jgi:p-hydroxybenzoic acid efflux pump subunit AaeB
MSSAAASLTLKWTSVGRDLFGDSRVRHGIKLALSGLLALFCTQILRVPRDAWAILTVMVLMSAQFVGAVAFKAVMRMAGSLVGAVVGVWLVCVYATTPAILLQAFFFVMVLAG